MLTAEGGDVLDQLEITVLAKASIVFTRATAHVRENLHHAKNLPEMLRAFGLMPNSSKK